MDCIKTDNNLITGLFQVKPACSYFLLDVFYL